VKIIRLVNNRVPEVQWIEIHWSLGIKEEALSSYLESIGLTTNVVYKLPSNSWAIPITENTNTKGE
jgi:hypothetical protein